MTLYPDTTSEIFPILDPAYWRERLLTAAYPHQALFVCIKDRWEAIEAVHRTILAQHIQPSDSILDIGCGWGRLLDLLPEGWNEEYLGIDISPDFIKIAREKYPERSFGVGDVRTLPLVSESTGYSHYVVEDSWDWAVLISFRPMFKRHLGVEEWGKAEAAIRKCARRLLYLEYDENDLTGSVE